MWGMSGLRGPRVLSPAEIYGLKLGIPLPSNGMSGLGDLAPQQINALATTGASTTVGILAALSLIPGPGWVAGAIAGVIAIGSQIANMFKGCGQTCVVATQDANKAEQLLQNNLDQYMTAPVHYKSLQLAAANNANTLFNALRQACSDPSLGPAGQRCISERLVKGGTAPWCPNPGNTGCDWITAYLDPIMNDPNVVPDPIAGSSTDTADPGSVVNAAASSTTNFTPLLLIGGAILLAAVLL